MLFWSLLMALAGVQTVMTLLFTRNVMEMARGPIKTRLLVLSATFQLQGIIALLAYFFLWVTGYGPEVSLPLLPLQALALLGTLILFDVTRI